MKIRIEMRDRRTAELLGYFTPAETPKTIEEARKIAERVNKAALDHPDPEQFNRVYIVSVSN